MTSQRNRPKRQTGSSPRRERPEIDFLILADSAQEVGGKLYVLGGGFAVHHATEYPSRFKFAVATGVLVPQSQAAKEQSFKFAVMKEGEGPLVEGGGTFAADRVVSMQVPLRANIVFEAQLLLPSPGIYEIWVEVSGAERSEFFEALPSQ